MPSAATMSINDGQATPVAHYFVPQGDNLKNGVFTFNDRTGGVPIGYNRLSFLLKEPAPARNGQGEGTRAYRGSIRIVVPMLETLSTTSGSGILAAPTLACTAIGQLDFTLPERSSLAMRKDFLAYWRNVLAHPYAENTFYDLEGLR